jgi:hypothetical protein
MNDERGIPDPNDRSADPEPVKDFDNHPTERPEHPSFDDFVEAFGRVLDHAEAQGEVYPGAVMDHALLRHAYHAAANYGDGPAADAFEHEAPSGRAVDLGLATGYDSEGVWHERDEA